MAPVIFSTLRSVVASEVASVQVIDVHTHLLPPSHGPLCLWGIDELLTYVRIPSTIALLFWLQIKFLNTPRLSYFAALSCG